MYTYFYILYFSIITNHHLPNLTKLPYSDGPKKTEDLFNLTNKFREENNKPPHVRNEMLDKAAQLMANKIIQNKYFPKNNNADVEKKLKERIESCGYKAERFSENCIVTKTDRAEDILKYWKARPDCKEKMLDSLEEVGYAMIKGLNGRFYWIGVYGSRDKKNENNQGNDESIADGENTGPETN